MWDMLSFTLQLFLVGYVRELAPCVLQIPQPPWLAAIDICIEPKLMELLGKARYELKIMLCLHL